MLKTSLSNEFYKRIKKALLPQETQMQTPEQEYDQESIIREAVRSSVSQIVKRLNHLSPVIGNMSPEDQTAFVQALESLNNLQNKMKTQLYEENQARLQQLKDK
jgi:3-deoxy-D-arabino-heptulosonate 7-phosphate (DAHP) synthase